MVLIEQAKTNTFGFRLSGVETVGWPAVHDEPTHTFDCVRVDSDLWYLKKLQFAIRIKTNTTWVRLSEVETVG